MGTKQISPRITLAIVVVVIGILLLWNHWDGRLTDVAILTGIGLILVGAHLIWIEMDQRED
jgi:drug/metabolite transporter (DMT)-like permease